MVHGYHIILGTYGHWLPNDPRGSWSEFVAAWELFQFGKPQRREVHPSFLDHPELAVVHRQAQQKLKHPPVVLTGLQAKSVGAGFSEAIRKSRLTVWACSILPQHVHLVVARGRLSSEWMANFFKGEATKQLKRDQLHPMSRSDSTEDDLPSPWERNQWKVFLNTEEDIENAIAYVEQNPVKEGKPLQRWTFVTPFAGLDPGSFV